MSKIGQSYKVKPRIFTFYKHTKWLTEGSRLQNMYKLKCLVTIITESIFSVFQERYESLALRKPERLLWKHLNLWKVIFSYENKNFDKNLVHILAHQSSSYYCQESGGNYCVKAISDIELIGKLFNIHSWKIKWLVWRFKLANYHLEVQANPKKIAQKNRRYF